MIKEYKCGERMYKRLRFFCPVCGTKVALAMGEAIFCDTCLEAGRYILLKAGGSIEKGITTLKVELKTKDVPVIGTRPPRSDEALDAVKAFDKIFKEVGENES